jgi:hypothetical protein
MTKLTTDASTALTDLFEAAKLNEEALTDWERAFVGDQMTRFDRYAEGTRFSEKQWGVLRRVAADECNVELPAYDEAFEE